MVSLTLRLLFALAAAQEPSEDVMAMARQSLPEMKQETDEPLEDTLAKVSLEDVNPAAICTDGTPATYYYKAAAAESASSTWLLYLDGGDWCYDAESCRKRCGDPSGPSDDVLCGSIRHPETETLQGIFAPRDHEGLMNAHKVYVKYCTSDGHMGDGEGFGFQFRGKVVVQAILRDLVERRGLGNSSSGARSRLIFGGGSAGARGAMVHLDYVSEMLGVAGANVDIVGFLDSPAWIDIAPFSSSFPGFAYITQQVHSYANVQHLGEACEATYSGGDAWKCMFGQYRLPTLKTRFFLVASQYDEYQLGDDVGHKPSNDAEITYAERFAAETKDLVNAVAAMPARNAVYSWACYNHMVSRTDIGFNFYSCDRSSFTMSGAFKTFLSGDSADTLFWIDACATWVCGDGCGASFRQVPSTVDAIVV